MYSHHLAQGEVRRSSSTAALKIESPVTVPVLQPARRTDHINAYQYGVRDGVWDGVVRDQVGIDVRSVNVLRFELGESRDSRVGSRIGIRDASGFHNEFLKLQLLV